MLSKESENCECLQANSMFQPQMEKGDGASNSLGAFLLLQIFKTVHEGCIYQLKLFYDKDYPEKPPSVRFHTRIKMTCVNHETGVVDSKKFGMLANWQRDFTMENILMQLK